MMACWNTNSAGRVTDIEIVEHNHETRSASAMVSTMGACDSNWMTDAMHSPFGLFTFLATAYGFESRSVASQALDQFDKVSGTAWVSILKGMAGL